MDGGRTVDKEGEAKNNNVSLSIVKVFQGKEMSTCALKENHVFS